MLFVIIWLLKLSKRAASQSQSARATAAAASTNAGSNESSTTRRSHAIPRVGEARTPMPPEALQYGHVPQAPPLAAAVDQPYHSNRRRGIITCGRSQTPLCTSMSSESLFSSAKKQAASSGLRQKGTPVAS